MDCSCKYCVLSCLEWASWPFALVRIGALADIFGSLVAEIGRGFLDLGAEFPRESAWPSWGIRVKGFLSLKTGTYSVIQ